MVIFNTNLFHLHFIANKPKLSLLSVIFNEDKYLNLSIGQALTVQQPDLEFVFLDDASIDDTPKYLYSKLLQDNRIKFLRHFYNQGRGYARYHAFKYSSGAHIMSLDADDFMDPSRIWDIYLKAVKSDADIFDFQANVVKYDNVTHRFKTIVRRFYQSRCLNTRDPNIIHRVFRRRYYLPAVWKKVFKRELIEKAFQMSMPFIKGTRFNAGEDTYLDSFLYLYSKKLGCTKRILYYYTGSSISSSDITKSQGDYADLIHKVLVSMLQHGKNYTDFDSVSNEVHKAPNIGTLYEQLPKIIPHEPHFNCSSYSRYPNVISISDHHDGLCFVSRMA